MPDSLVTKKALASSLKTLMKKEPFTKISIRDICEGCGMNRKSFYYHFKDKYHLVNWIFYTEFIDSVKSADPLSSWEFMQKICNYFYSEREFYQKALLIEGQNSFRSYFSETIKPFLQKFSEKTLCQTRNITPEDSVFFVTFFTDAFLCSLIRWLTEEKEKPPEKYLEQLWGVIFGFAMQVMEGLNKE